MANKRNERMKKQRYAERLEEKQIHKAAKVAAQHSFTIAMYAVKDVFKERASNPKMEAFIVRMFELWDKVADGDVRIETLASSIEAETGIRYDLKTGEIRNMKGREK
jgi:hypothetical protein